MLKPHAALPWLNDVEVVEEHLESLKLSSAQAFHPVKLKGPSLVRSTAGLLGTRVSPGRTYERRLRQDWERASRLRTA